MDNKLKPAIIGGVVLGVLSSIPFVNLVNMCCCLWAIVGGALATNLYIKSSPNPVNPGEGAILGAIAGAVGGLISVILGIPLAIASSSAMQALLISIFQSMDPRAAEALAGSFARGSTVGGAIINGLIQAVVLFIFSIIGGLIAVPLFEKRKGGTLPPPPPAPGGAPFAA